MPIRATPSASGNAGPWLHQAAIRSFHCATGFYSENISLVFFFFFKKCQMYRQLARMANTTYLPPDLPGVTIKNIYLPITFSSLPIKTRVLPPNHWEAQCRCHVTWPARDPGRCRYHHGHTPRAQAPCPAQLTRGPAHTPLSYADPAPDLSPNAPMTQSYEVFLVETLFSGTTLKMYFV